MSSENERLKKEIDRLKHELEKVRQEKDKILEEKDKILEEKDKILEEKDKILEEKKNIEKEFKEFKAKHSKTVSELQKALKIKEDKKTKSNPVGAVKGHKPYFRKIPERIDYIKALNPNKCPHCNTKLGKTQEIRNRYVTDIELVLKTKTTQYEIHRKYCTKCKKLVEKEATNVLPHARFGLNLMLFVMYLKLGLRLPGSKVCEFLSTMYDLTISEGEVVHILKQLANEFGDYYESLEKIVKLARVKHTDSTGWRINGKNYFAWTFIATGAIIYKIAKRNNHKVPMVLFGKKQKNNVLCVDRHSAFRTLAEKVGFLLQLCWSHILTDTKQLAKNFGAEGLYVHEKLKAIFDIANRLNHKGTAEMVEQFKGEIFQLTLRHYKHITIRRFVNNLYYRDVENLFRFVTDPNIDPTNNISERELRELVIQRKISHGSRSTRGANTTAKLLSVIQTLRFKNENVLRGLQAILKNPSRY